MTRSRRRQSEHGFVMVPVIALLAVALGLGFALLSIVDTQTSQGRTQRMSDASQTLAEGVATATANALATDRSAANWPTSGACLPTITGNLSNPPSTLPTTSLAYRVVTEVQARFAATSADYASTTRDTTWRVDICPIAAGDSRWSDTFLSRTVGPGTPASPISVWVRGQASVRTVGVTQDARTRAVATKVRQSNVVFTPPLGFAVGTGSFSTDLSTGLDTILTNNTALVGGLLTTVLKTTPTIAPATSKIGLRCGLLSNVGNLSSVCLSGTIASINAVNNALNLGQLNDILGIGRTVSLATWTMAPADAIAAWKAEAQSTGGVYKDVGVVAGNGDDRTRTGASGPPASECFSETTTNLSVVYIKQVGNGEQYCTVSGTRTAKILIVEKGAIRITGAFTGVVYALNKQECTQSDGSCSSANRASAVPREVVRVEGMTGKVIGQVWADGAGGSVGVYPSMTPVSPTKDDLINRIGNASGICGAANLTTALNSLQSTLDGVGALLGQLVGNKQVRYPGGVSTQPDRCVLLKAALNTKTVTQLEQLYQSGGSLSITVSEHRTCSLLGLLGACIGTWSVWSVDASDMVTLTIPPLLTDAPLAGLVGQLTTILGSTLAPTGYAAITYEPAVVGNAGAVITTGAGPVVGTYRNVPPV